MAERLYYFVFLAVVVLATVSALDDSAQGILTQHIERLEAKLAEIEDKQQLREAELVAKIEQLETRVSSLEANNDELSKANVQFRAKIRQFLQKLRSEPDAAPDIIEQEPDTNKRKLGSKIRQRNIVPRDQDVQKTRQLMNRPLNVAFSSYLDHDTDGLGDGQTLVFNQILLNEGSSYSKYTGVFTAPTTGVYSFTFFIGQRNINQLYVGLNVNNVNKVDAVVQTDNNYEDAQGGNSVLLKLSAGDNVYVQKISKIAGTHIEGSGNLRFTTFSGFLLYPLP